MENGVRRIKREEFATLVKSHLSYLELKIGLDRVHPFLAAEFHPSDEGLYNLCKIVRDKVAEISTDSSHIRTPRLY